MIVVTAPTGNIGHEVVANLIAEKADVRVIVRDASKLSDNVRDQVDVIEGSHAEASVLDRALDGADALFWLVPPDVTKTLDQSYLDFTRPSVDAIRRHKVARVVSISALGRDTSWEERAGLVTASIHMQDMLNTSGAATRALALPSFMDNTLRQVATISAMGLLFGTIDPEMKAPTIATRDIGITSARLLADEKWTGQEEVPVLGPEDLSPNELAAIISEVTGRDVRYQQTSLDAFRQQLLGQGVTPSFAQGYVDMMRAKGDGMDSVAVTSSSPRSPTSFRQWCEEYLKPALIDLKT
jgi:uncharacterized protein YbjT (DUF2867 family)